MKAPEHLLSVLIFTEDTGAQVEPALRCLLKKMFQLIENCCGTHRIEFLPTDDDSRRALAGKFHAGNTGKAYRDRLQLAGKIADQIAKSDPEGFVAYHSDADCRWSDRASKEYSDYSRLRDVVAERLRTPRRISGNTIDLDRIERFILLAPYWELESWLYLNVEVARRICEHHDDGNHLSLFDEWEADLAVIDEIENTKDVCCLLDRYNIDLAQNAFPKDKAYAAGTSFAETVNRLKECNSLVEALGRTTG